MTSQADARQAAYAEEELAEWLAYPAELGDRPDEIELMQTVEADTADGPCDLFVFRFRVREPHWAAGYGWMIGVAGPYLRSIQPTADGLGYTFSRLEREEAMTIEEHVDQLFGTVHEWAAAIGDQTE